MSDMIMPTHRVRILVATQPVDFRKGHDGLAALVQSALKEDPFTGTVFVFRAKRADRLKILFWEDEEDQETVRGTVPPTNGLVMAYKRLEETTFVWPAIRDGVMTLRPKRSLRLCSRAWIGVRCGRWKRADRLRQNESDTLKRRAFTDASGYVGGMPIAATKDLDLSVLPPDYRAAFEALQATAARVAALEEINKRLEHLVAEMNHALHGKKSEKLNEDDRQLAFEDLSIAVAEAEEQKRQTAPDSDKPKRKGVAKRNRGNLPEHLPRIEQVVEPDSLMCPCGCGVAIVARTNGATMTTAQDRCRAESTPSA